MNIQKILQNPLFKDNLMKIIQNLPDISSLKSLIIKISSKTNIFALLARMDVIKLASYMS